MTPREFRQEKEFEFDHFIELTSTGIKPNYVNIELFAQEYHQAKLKLLDIPVVTQQRELLFAYEKMRTSHIIGATDEWRYTNVDLFISKL